MSIEVPIVTKNNPRSKPLNGLISALIRVQKFVSANNAPAKNAPSYTMKNKIKLNGVSRYIY